MTDAPLKAGHMAQRENKEQLIFQYDDQLVCDYAQDPVKEMYKTNDLHWLSWPVSVFLRVCMVGIGGAVAKEARIV